MATPILISYPSSPTSDSGLSLKQIAYFGRVLVKVSTLAEAEQFLRQNFRTLDVFVDATEIASAGDLVDILNAGAAKILITLDQLTTLSEEQSVPSSRLLVNAPSDSQLDTLAQWIAANAERNDASVCTAPATISAAAEKLKISSDSPRLFTTITEPSEDVISKVTQQGAIAIVPSQALTVERDVAGKISAAKLIAARAVTDQANGLYATSVTDERGSCLGFVWSSDESIVEALRTGTGVYQSRKRGLWYKGQSSGDVQELLRIGFDCDADCLVFVVKQIGRGKNMIILFIDIFLLTLDSLGFCHLGTESCFGASAGLSRLQKTLDARKADAPAGSYTARLFNEPKLIDAKIMEEADELCRAQTKEEVAFEAADLFYFALTKCTAAGVSLEDIERNLDLKSLKVKRRKGDAKGPWAEKAGLAKAESKPAPAPAPAPAPVEDRTSRIEMKRVITSSTSPKVVSDYLKRPSQKSNDAIVALVKPIIQDVRDGGDAAVLKYTHKFENATSLTSPVIHAPFPAELMKLTPDVQEAIDISIGNIDRFHSAQKSSNDTLQMETMPGVVCSRFSRPIERVGLYIPGGTAVLPSTAMMLGVPAMVAGCNKIVLASPPRSDGSISPEIVYVAHKVGAESIVLAGGAQAVAAMAYGTESITKVDKILGPGNQFVTAAKMFVSNDTSAGVSIDMPAGPSEVLVIADKTANPAFVASDLLSQAEHGVDSQVILIAVDLTEAELAAIEDEVDAQAKALPRMDIVRGSLAHSVTFVVRDINEAMILSNDYAPEHLILQVQNPESVVEQVQNAGSVFIGPWTPESVGDYSAGVNHSLRKSPIQIS
jgi:phosphoribosyl-ATP pyrophosphohydrolase/phosphoribosyl-AMP cyclohydrolase/histidinol dehydrogenase